MVTWLPPLSISTFYYQTTCFPLHSTLFIKNTSNFLPSHFQDSLLYYHPSHVSAAIDTADCFPTTQFSLVKILWLSLGWFSSCFCTGGFTASSDSSIPSSVSAQAFAYIIMLQTASLTNFMNPTPHPNFDLSHCSVSSLWLSWSSYLDTQTQCDNNWALLLQNPCSFLLIIHLAVIFESFFSPLIHATINPLIPMPLQSEKSLSAPFSSLTFMTSMSPLPLSSPTSSFFQPIQDAVTKMISPTHCPSFSQAGSSYPSRGIFLPGLNLSAHLL